MAPPEHPPTDTPTQVTSRGLQREIFDLHAVFEITRGFSAVLDTQALMDGILLTAIGQLGVGAGAVVVRDPADDSRLSVCKRKGWPEVSLGDWEIALDSRYARLLESLDGPALVRELRPRLDRTWPVTGLLYGLDCQMISPLKRRERLLGVVYTSGRLNGHRFTEADLRFWGLILEQFAVSIENAILYESERRAAAELIRTRDLLAQEEQMAMLGRLSAAIAHEVNNPLGIIRNYLQILAQEMEEHSEAQRTLALVTAEVDRIARTVRQLLDAFHPHTSRPTVVDIGSALDQVLEFLGPELRRNGVVIDRPASASLPFVAAREDPLRQVFINLTLNARDAMPKGGTLRIRAFAEGDTVSVTFTDEGPGLDDEALGRLFDPFYSTKERGRGTGLGLSICRNIIEGFGGRIEAGNVAGVGSGAVFRVSLPRMDIHRGKQSPQIPEGEPR